MLLLCLSLVQSVLWWRFLFLYIPGGLFPFSFATILALFTCIFLGLFSCHHGMVYIELDWL